MLRQFRMGNKYFALYRLCSVQVVKLVVIEDTTPNYNDELLLMSTTNTSRLAELLEKYLVIEIFVIVKKTISDRVTFRDALIELSIRILREVILQTGIIE